MQTACGPICDCMWKETLKITSSFPFLVMWKQIENYEVNLNADLGV